MKDFLILIRGGDGRLEELDEEGRNAHMQAWGVFMGQLSENGNLTGGLPLTAEGRVLRKEGVSEGVVLSDDGSAIGGYLLLSAKDYDHAVELTRNCPVFEYDGNLEIREAMHMDQ